MNPKGSEADRLFHRQLVPPTKCGVLNRLRRFGVWPARTVLVNRVVVESLESAYEHEWEAVPAGCLRDPGNGDSEASGYEMISKIQVRFRARIGRSGTGRNASSGDVAMPCVKSLGRWRGGKSVAGRSLGSKHVGQAEPSLPGAGHTSGADGRGRCVVKAIC